MHVEDLVWCNQHGTDGRIPAYALRRVTDEGDAEAGADQLVAVGLWAVTEDGWSIIDFLTDQPSAADVERQQVLGRNRQRVRRQHVAGDHSLCDAKYCRAAQAGGSRVTNGVSNGESHGTRTDPTRPDPKGRGGVGKGKGSSTSDEGSAALAPASAPSPGGSPSPSKSKGSTEELPAHPARQAPVWLATDGALQGAGDGDGVGEPNTQDRPPCPHGVAGGLDATEDYVFRCPECEKVAPRTSSDKFHAWWGRSNSDVREFVDRSPEVTCADPDNERYADRLARVKFAATLDLDPAFKVPPRDEPFWRVLKAHTVMQVEPGRLRLLMQGAIP
jgi:hypothetical protein